MLIDTHCHLDFDDFAPELDSVIERAQQADVWRMVTICTRIRQFHQVLAVAQKYDPVFCSVGTHPNHAHEEQDISVEEILALTEYEKVVAIGEAGLDYHYDYATPLQQRSSFLNHIEVARQTQLPLVIHARNADADMASILQQEMKKGTFPFILHCYSSGQQLAEIGLELGGYISFSGIVTFKNAAELRDIVKIVPVERLLVETDAPYLAPVPFRGKRNEPAFVAKTAGFLSDFLGLDYEKFAAITTQNALNLFQKMSPPKKAS